MVPYPSTLGHSPGLPHLFGSSPPRTIHYPTIDPIAPSHLRCYASRHTKLQYTIVRYSILQVLFSTQPPHDSSQPYTNPSTPLHIEIHHPTKVQKSPKVTTTHDNLTTIIATIHDKLPNSPISPPSPSDIPIGQESKIRPNPSTNSQHHVKESTAGRKTTGGAQRTLMSLPLAACACVTSSSHYQISHGD